MDEDADILEKDGSTHLADFHFDHGLRRFQLSKKDFKLMYTQ